MRAVVQRCRRAQVTVDDTVVGGIGSGLCVLLGAGRGDGREDVDYVVDKIAHLRVFPDDDGKMNRSVLEIGGGVLLISQFTLYGDTRKGRRPAFVDALAPEPARVLYEAALRGLEARGVARVASGIFGADMQVELVNDGPVTLLIDSRRTP